MVLLKNLIVSFILATFAVDASPVGIGGLGSLAKGAEALDKDASAASKSSKGGSGLLADFEGKKGSAAAPPALSKPGPPPALNAASLMAASPAPLKPAPPAPPKAAAHPPAAARQKRPAPGSPTSQPPAKKPATAFTNTKIKSNKKNKNKQKNKNKPPPPLNAPTKPLTNPLDAQLKFKCGRHTIPSAQVTAAIARGLQFKNAGTRALDVQPKKPGDRFRLGFPHTFHNDEGLKLDKACKNAPGGAIQEFPILESGQVVNQGSLDPRTADNPGLHRAFFTIADGAPTFCGVGTRVDSNHFVLCT